MAVQYTGTGRRKRAIARVFLRPGTGKFTVNGSELDKYFFGRKLWIDRILEPLVITGNEGKFDVLVLVSGGGTNGQADAIRLGLGRALVEFDYNTRAVLKPVGILKRDQREVERKHYYHLKARKSPQYSKR